MYSIKREQHNRSRSGKKHGMSETRPWIAWNNMRARCNYPNYIQFDGYGGRGITYDKKWDTFEGFWEDMEAGYKDDLTLDRIDNDGNYCKENCRWITQHEQCRNKSNNRNLSYGGKTQCVVDWARDTGMNVKTLWARLERGWSVEKTLTTKVGNYGVKK